MHAATPIPDSPLPHSRPRPEPLAQVEVLVLFHPDLQTIGSHRVPAEICARATQGWLTLDVYGYPSTSDLTGRPVMEDMRLEINGEDIESLLPDSIVNHVADYVLGDD
jgi:hypothetical protein